MQVFNFHPPVPAPGLAVSAAPPAGSSAMAQPWRLPASLEGYVQWADPQETIGSIPACYLPDTTPFVDLHVVKTIDGGCVAGQVDETGQRLAAFGPDGNICAHFALLSRGFGGPGLWHRVSSTAGWTEALFNVERDRFHIHALDVGLREYELNDAYATVANHSPEAIEAAWATFVKKWDPFTQPVLRDAIELLAGQAEEDGAPATHVAALHRLATTFQATPPFEGSFRDMIARHRSSRDWWRAASETESDSVKRLDAHCRQRRQIDADLSALRHKILLNGAALRDALGAHVVFNPDALCQLLAAEWRGEARLMRLGGFVLNEAALLPSLKQNLQSVFARLSFSRAQPPPDLAMAEAAIVASLTEPQVINTLGRLRSLERQYARLEDDLSNAVRHELTLRTGLCNLRTARVEERERQIQAIIPARLQAMFETLPANIDRATMTATMDEVLACWTNIQPGMKWVLFLPHVCEGTELDALLEGIRDEGAPGVTDASVEHFGQVMSAPANVCAVEVIRHTLHDYRCVLIEKDLLAAERQAIRRAGEVVFPGISLDYVVQHGPSAIFSVLRTNHDRFQMLMTPEMKRYESERYGHHLAALESTEDPARFLREERLRICPGLNHHLPDDELKSVVSRVVDGVALVRALTDHLGECALGNRDVAMGVRLFETAEEVNPGVSGPLAQWRTGALEEKRDRLQKLSLETMRWFYGDIEPLLVYALNHPDWD